MKKLKGSLPTARETLHQIKALTKKSIEKLTKKRQAICGLREGAGREKGLLTFSPSLQKK